MAVTIAECSDSENNAFGDLSIGKHYVGLSGNTAIGDDSLRNLVAADPLYGSGNVAVGDEAGHRFGGKRQQLHLAIGAPAAAGPFADLVTPASSAASSVNRLAIQARQTAVFVDQFNVMGVIHSSRRSKHDIQPMDKASGTLYRLKPVTFKFNSDWKGTTQYGLIAEEVEKVHRQLAAPQRMVKGIPCGSSRSTRCCSTSSLKNTKKCRTY